MAKIEQNVHLFIENSYFLTFNPMRDGDVSQFTKMFLF